MGAAYKWVSEKLTSKIYSAWFNPPSHIPSLSSRGCLKTVVAYNGCRLKNLKNLLKMGVAYEWVVVYIRAYFIYTFLNPKPGRTTFPQPINSKRRQARQESIVAVMAGKNTPDQPPWLSNLSSLRLEHPTILVPPPPLHQTQSYRPPKPITPACLAAPSAPTPAAPLPTAPGRPPSSPSPRPPPLPCLRPDSGGSGIRSLKKKRRQRKSISLDSGTKKHRNPYFTTVLAMIESLDLPSSGESRKRE